MLSFGPRDALARRIIRLRDVNWLGTGEPGTGNVFVKIRSTRPAVPARITPDDGEQMEIVLDEADFGISPGQACVFYEAPGQNARVLGGGYIAGTGK